uniref:hypothetical protein n=1 Tax=Ruminococcus sp. 2227st1_E6_2227SCRN_220401 TaxID=3143052 RepID=UPI00319E3562
LRTALYLRKAVPSPKGTWEARDFSRERLHVLHSDSHTEHFHQAFIFEIADFFFLPIFLLRKNKKYILILRNFKKGEDKYAFFTQSKKSSEPC